ncbi:hypothetical protein A676_04005 [Salmonella enterica subsp. enterica serovar Enteritidis str. 2010K-0262]|uniref:Uncharacterized protein n=1 Tax=Salmonella enterica subsp. enterica serovar Dublin str. UC16 TaxID=1192688 RepID=M7RER8_SALDU|nr:hypothetical protein A670_04749 [Salmonella enterica subsp. enterica serovar Dublin str. UC16]EPI80223.1 hypothetical protein A676_04005 [Salmonella enterica subsp. enterica serovar Enteritidis str. 2010K-0262]EPI93781.1 hypothetical protein A678_04581 [Salmonella enterica subsp. enterica serovar Enteritidis str. 2010K-0271]EPI95561.1 hypothetical protein A679_04244 [Salmonella enterica subsp. enterica serovar Enteritidis str. 2010K-0284]
MASCWSYFPKSGKPAAESTSATALALGWPRSSQTRLRATPDFSVS